MAARAQIADAFELEAPILYYVGEPVISELADAIGVALTKLSDSQGLRVAARFDMRSLWAAAHVAVAAATGAMIHPVLPDGWVEINNFGGPQT